MPSGNRNLHLPQLQLHHHHHHHNHGHGDPGNYGKQQIRDVPKGCLAIKVGQIGQEQHRFVVPMMYFNHPSFMRLLKGAEEEYGFDQKGTITIPCHVEEFRHVQDIIDKEATHRQHPVGCFWV